MIISFPSFFIFSTSRNLLVFVCVCPMRLFIYFISFFLALSSLGTEAFLAALIFVVVVFFHQSVAQITSALSFFIYSIKGLSMGVPDSP